jgi:hypothetical protein
MCTCSALDLQGLIEKAAPTLASTYAISKAVRIPVMAASGTFLPLFLFLSLKFAAQESRMSPRR